MRQAEIQICRATPLMRFRRCLLGLLLLIVAGCSRDVPDQRIITLWHQMNTAEREVLDERIAEYERANPGVRVRALYKETEELRSGFEAAALAGIGPELVFGPSDVLELYQTMGIVRDMSPWFPKEVTDQFVESAVTRLPSPATGKEELLQVGDRVGNHLALVYNRRYLDKPPETTDDLIRMAQENTVDEDGDGRFDRYGLAWNYVEPFFVVPFLTGYGAWVFEENTDDVPSLDTPESVKAFEFIVSLRDKYKVVPRGCDLEMADAMFKDGTAAMIINGDWSWRGYLNFPGLDAAVAPLPIVSATGKPMAPMVATKGYSLNAFTTGERADLAMEFVKFMTSEETQRNFMVELKTMPSRKALLEDPLLTSDPTLAASAEQLRRGRAMPVVAEMRAIWDSMRPHYQAILGGNATAADAASAMQRDAVKKIEEMNREYVAGTGAVVCKVVGGGILLTLLAWQIPAFLRFLADWKTNRLAYLFVWPALAVIFLTVVFPFAFNVVLSFSNMSMKHFQDWKIVGWQNYAAVFTEPRFFAVLGLTLIWTFVNLFFHVSIGVLLAVALNGVAHGKNLYRTLLIIPWAVPAYITALTWRGMFDYEYGAVNLMWGRLLNLLPEVVTAQMPEVAGQINWLGEPIPAFIACTVANIWLGFPFMMVIALGGLQGIPVELYEAARIDRASRWQQFWNITVPMLRPVLLPAITLGTIWTFNNLNVIWLVSNGGQPEDKTHILVSYVYKAVFNQYRYAYGAALSMIIFFMLLAFSVVFLRKTQAAEAVG